MNIFTSDNTPLSIATNGKQQRAAGCNLHTIARTTLTVTSYIDAALASNSRRAYRSDLADFLNWPGALLPCTPDILAAYVADCAARLSPVTISRRVVAIGRAHTSQGFPNPAKSDLVRTVLRGVRKAHGAPQRQATPLLRDDLVCLLPRASDITSVRDRALLLLGFASAMRRAELVSLDISDLHFVGEGLEVHVRRSKTDVEGHGRKIAIPYGKSTSSCPVTATREWVERSCISDGPVFRSISKGGQVKPARLTAQSISLILRHRAINASFDTARLSAHSLRAGLVTSAAKAGIPAYKIQAQTGHRSIEMLNRYIRDAQLFDGNAASAL